MTHRTGPTLLASATCLVALLLAPASAATASRVVTDQAGDANATSALTESPSTPPASRAADDLRYVDIDRQSDVLKVHFGLTALPDDTGDGVETFYRLNATLGACEFHIGVRTFGVVGTGRPLSPFFDTVSGCPKTDAIFSDPRWTAARSAAVGELVVSFPLTSLPEYVPGLGPAARLTRISADVSIGTYAGAAGTATPRIERYGTVVVDAAPGGLDYVIPCLEQEC